MCVLSNASGVAIKTLSLPPPPGPTHGAHCMSSLGDGDHTELHILTVDCYVYVGRSEAAERGHESGVGRQERRRGEREDGHHRRLARRAGVGHRRRRAHAMCTVVEACINIHHHITSHHPSVGSVCLLCRLGPIPGVGIARSRAFQLFFRGIPLELESLESKGEGVGS